MTLIEMIYWGFFIFVAGFGSRIGYDLYGFFGLVLGFFIALGIVAITPSFLVFITEIWQRKFKSSKRNSK
jgi:hypothetical protein